MPETRYIDEYDGQGNLVNHIPYTVSDAQLAEELADRRMNELRELLKQGASVIVSQPVTGEFRVISIEKQADGKQQWTTNDVAE